MRHCGDYGGHHAPNHQAAEAPAGVIQEVMCDPEITVAIFSVTRPIAA
jgi:hypothetical protein